MKKLQAVISMKKVFRKLTEECAELIHAMAKFASNPKSKVRKKNLIEELADVDIFLSSLKNKLSDDDLLYYEAYKKGKANKLAKRYN